MSARACFPLRRVGMVLSSLCSSIAGVGDGSDQQLAAHEAARLLGPGVGECVGRAALDHAAAMYEHDLAGEALRLAEIVLPRPLAMARPCWASTWHRASYLPAMRTVRCRSPISRRTSSRC